eukprot:XP_001709728.1 Hypothetical protein GL50803_26439 [Giardia lamblia ATCC 50803]
MGSVAHYRLASGSYNKPFTDALQSHNRTHTLVHRSNSSQVITKDLNIIGIKCKWVDKVLDRLFRIIDDPTVTGVAIL